MVCYIFIVRHCVGGYRAGMLGSGFMINEGAVGFSCLWQTAQSAYSYYVAIFAQVSADRNLWEYHNHSTKYPGNAGDGARV